MSLTERLNELESMRRNGQISDTEYAMLVASANKKYENESVLTDSYSGEPRINLVEKNAPRSMSFFESISYSYKNYANFRGRASRSEFWYWQLNLICVYLGLILFVGYSELIGFSFLQIFAYFVFALFILSFPIPHFARIVRRLHDTNKSWPYLLILLIPLFGSILLIVWLCTDGDSRPNRFGPSDPSKNSPAVSSVWAKPSPASSTQQVFADGKRKSSFSLKRQVIITLTVFSMLFLGIVQLFLEYGSLIDSIETSEKLMLDYITAESKLYQENVSGSPPKFNSYESQGRWETKIIGISEYYENRLGLAGNSISEVHASPWHTKLNQIRSLYLDHNEAWRAQLSARAEDPYFGNDPQVESTFKIFCGAFMKAPRYTFSFYDSRIESICQS